MSLTFKGIEKSGSHSLLSASSSSTTVSISDSSYLGILAVLSQFKNDPFKLVSSNLHVLQICESSRKFRNFARKLSETWQRIFPLFFFLWNGFMHLSFQISRSFSEDIIRKVLLHNLKRKLTYKVIYV